MFNFMAISIGKQYLAFKVLYFHPNYLLQTKLKINKVSTINKKNTVYALHIAYSCVKRYKHSHLIHFRKDCPFLWRILYVHIMNNILSTWDCQHYR